MTYETVRQRLTPDEKINLVCRVLDAGFVTMSRCDPEKYQGHVYVHEADPERPSTLYREVGFIGLDSAHLVDVEKPDLKAHHNSLRQAFKAA